MFLPDYGVEAAESAAGGGQSGGREASRGIGRADDKWFLRGAVIIDPILYQLGIRLALISDRGIVLIQLSSRGCKIVSILASSIPNPVRLKSECRHLTERKARRICCLIGLYLTG